MIHLWAFRGINLAFRSPRSLRRLGGRRRTRESPIPPPVFVLLYRRSGGPLRPSTAPPTGIASIISTTGHRPRPVFTNRTSDPASNRRRPLSIWPAERPIFLRTAFDDRIGPSWPDTRRTNQRQIPAANADPPRSCALASHSIGIGPARKAPRFSRGFLGWLGSSAAEITPKSSILRIINPYPL